jgi:hypothetical protein
MRIFILIFAVVATLFSLAVGQTKSGPVTKNASLYSCVGNNCLNNAFWGTEYVQKCTITCKFSPKTKTTTWVAAECGGKKADGYCCQVNADPCPLKLCGQGNGGGRYQIGKKGTPGG